MSRALFLILIGLGGAAILISLGIWQIQRLAWKQSVLADINARISAAPVTLPENPNPETDAYLPVKISGTLGEKTLRVLVSQKDVGAGYRLISVLETSDMGRIMVDRGFVATDAVAPDVPTRMITVTGNLQWPQETDDFTPAPDLAGNIWFARDVPDMSRVLDAKPLLVVARSLSFDTGPVMPLPVDTARIPNDHLQYAITWFSLAAIWAAMSLYFVRRRARST